MWINFRGRIGAFFENFKGTLKRDRIPIRELIRSSRKELFTENKEEKYLNIIALLEKKGTGLNDILPYLKKSEAAIETLRKELQDLVREEIQIFYLILNQMIYVLGEDIKYRKYVPILEQYRLKVQKDIEEITALVNENPQQWLNRYSHVNPHVFARN